MDTRRVNLLTGLLEKRRMRVLASDGRAGSWARGRARVAQREYLREHWRVYAGFISMLLAVTLVVASLMPTGFLSGFVAGAFLVAGLALLWSWTVQVTGTAPVMMGDVAEQWTASQLRRLRERGWRMVNHFVLAIDDIDHVLVGPGGAYAVETKWSATAWDSEFGSARLREAVRQAEANARRLHLWHPFKSRHVQVAPVVVVWGGGVRNWSESELVSCFDGVTVLAGQALRSWIADRPAPVLREEEIAEVWSALAAQVARRDPADALAHPVPASVGEVVTRIGAALVFAVLGVIFLGQLVRYIEPSWLALLIGATAVVPSVILIRSSIARPAAWGWLFGVGLPVGALSIAEVMYRATP